MPFSWFFGLPVALQAGFALLVVGMLTYAIGGAIVDRREREQWSTTAENAGDRFADATNGVLTTTRVIVLAGMGFVGMLAAETAVVLGDVGAWASESPLVVSNAIAVAIAFVGLEGGLPVIGQIDVEPVVLLTILVGSTLVAVMWRYQ